MPPIWSCFREVLSEHHWFFFIFINPWFVDLLETSPGVSFIFFMNKPCNQCFIKNPHNILHLYERVPENWYFAFKKKYFHAFSPRTPVLVECKMCAQIYKDELKGRKAGGKQPTRFFCWVLSSHRGQIQTETVQWIDRNLMKLIHGLLKSASHSLTSKPIPLK